MAAPASRPGRRFTSSASSVPFGEVIPFRSFLDTFTSLPSLQPVNFTPGHKAVVFHIGKIRLGDVICYEVGFDGLVSSEVAAGANLLTVQTNDADFELDGQTGETLQQLAMARVRAVEHDRAVVVASTTGVSAIIAPNGRAARPHRTLWRPASVEARVPLRTVTTLADRLGGWPEVILTGSAIAALAWVIGGAIAEPGRRRPPSPAPPQNKAVDGQAGPDDTPGASSGGTSPQETSSPATRARETSSPATRAQETSSQATRARVTSALGTSDPATSEPETSEPGTGGPGTGAGRTGADQGAGRRRRWSSLRQPARWAALLAGALLVLAFPDANIGFLAWFGLVPGLVLMAVAPTRREAFTRGWWFGAGYVLATMYWLAPNLGPGLLLVALVIGFL